MHSILVCLLILPCAFDLATTARSFVYEHVNNETNGNDQSCSVDDGCGGGATLECVFNEQYENLVLEGGGMKSVSYVGAMKAFLDHDYYRDGAYTFKNIAGTSAGCLFGFLISLDIHPNLLEELVYNTDFANILFSPVVSDILNCLPPLHQSKAEQQPSSIFNLITFPYTVLKIAMNIIKLWTLDNPGLDTPKHIITWLMMSVIPQSQYEDRINIDTTMDDLYHITGHNLTCFAARLNDNKILTYNRFTTPNKTIFDVMTDSMALPLLFKPSVDMPESPFPIVDGGIFNNFPIGFFDTSDYLCSRTVGLSLQKNISDRNVRSSVSVATTTTNDISKKYSTLDYFTMLYSALMAREATFYSSDVRNRNRIVYLDSPLSTLSRDHEINILMMAINRAYLNTLKFLRRSSSNFQYQQQEK